MIWNIIPEELRSKHIACNTLGDQFIYSDEQCWNAQDALEVLIYMDNTRIGIIGGDVLRIRDGIGEYCLGCSWYSAFRRNEDYNKYIKRSRLETRNHIMNINRNIKEYEPFYILSFINEYRYNIMKEDL